MNKKVSLFLAHKDVPARMDVVQGATAPAITFILEDYTPNAGSQCQLYIQKKNSEVYNSCTLSGNEVTFSPTTGSFDEVGLCTAQLQVTSGGTIAVSYRIHVRVEPNIIDGDAIEADDDFSALQQAIIDVGNVSEWKAKTDQNTSDITTINSVLPRKVDFSTTATTDAAVGQTTSSMVQIRVNSANFGDRAILAQDGRLRVYDYDNNAALYDLFPITLLESGTSNPDVNVPHNTWTTVLPITFTPGTYHLEYSVRFGTNAVGRRAIVLSDNENTSTSKGYLWNDTCMAVDGTNTYLRGSGTIRIASTQTVYLNAFHNAGTGVTLVAQPRISILKLI